MHDIQLAPVDRPPSPGFMSIFSTISEYCLPSAPTQWIVMARTPAIGPRPNAMTKISAKTISGTVRQNSIRRLTAMRSQGAGAVFSAARKFSAKGRGPGQRADIADQDRLAQQQRPFVP